jgi:hypothetical protein
MEIQGKVGQLLPLQTGSGKNGPWKKQEFILETEGQVPRKICFSAWGDKVDQFGLAAGETVIVHFDLESREFNGRWYTDARAWKVTRPGTPSGSRPQSEPGPEFPPPDDMMPQAGDDLPF